MTSHSRGAHMEAELTSQPDTWRQAATLAETAPLPQRGQRVVVLGCGTSWFMAQSYAVMREQAGHGLTDAFSASEAPLERDYDLAILLSRSGTTTEVMAAAKNLQGRVPLLGIVGDPDTPLPTLVDDVVVLDFADEASVVQTRFATTALTLLRAGLGMDVTPSIADAEAALAAPIDARLVTADQITFLGSGWAVGLAHEAALKNREASQSWTESYPAMEYRHGPISVAAPGRATWVLGAAPDGLADDVAGTGATYVEHADVDPLAELVTAQRVALERARARDLDPDHPRALSRSVILG
ncbi:SIS domain-containing protein [Pseudactinotalea suaedae]|uniref:SIS domain-containing protein n=1 Tax=Pseudactinotalea suaedae TaxID=1524924 RepID=UPI001F4FFF9A|nr:SIS domain-containing protein [Pseudactinotalea suaedae]